MKRDEGQIISDSVCTWNKYNLVRGILMEFLLTNKNFKLYIYTHSPVMHVQHFIMQCLNHKYNYSVIRTSLT